ncbi:hypothetical protein TRECRb50_07820 [Escherichia coli]|nr:hypothetical protein TRECRb50_07820 [Escherichia coli]
MIIFTILTIDLSGVYTSEHSFFHDLYQIYNLILSFDFWVYKKDINIFLNYEINIPRSQPLTNTAKNIKV